MAIPAKPLSATAINKLRRAQEASQSLKAYEAERLAVRAKTERLRAERLAREATTTTSPKTKKK